MNYFVNTLPLALVSVFCAAIFSAPVSAEFNVEEQAMIGWIDEQSEDAIDLLEQLVSISSGTMNQEGVRKVGDVLRAELDELDTVFEAADPFQAYSREGNIGKGPGIDDMKSGDVIIIYALKALREIGALDDA